jgi:PPOX class probable F420-dependent enzyme
MEITAHPPADDRERVEARLRHNLIAWLTSVRPDGQPVSVPVWFLVRDDSTILVYSQPGKAKLRNLAGNPRVSLALDAWTAKSGCRRRTIVSSSRFPACTRSGSCS